MSIIQIIIRVDKILLSNNCPKYLYKSSFHFFIFSMTANFWKSFLNEQQARNVDKKSFLWLLHKKTRRQNCRRIPRRRYWRRRRKLSAERQVWRVSRLTSDPCWQLQIITLTTITHVITICSSNKHLDNSLKQVMHISHLLTTAWL